MNQPSSKVIKTSNGTYMLDPTTNEMTLIEGTQTDPDQDLRQKVISNLQRNLLPDQITEQVIQQQMNLIKGTTASGGNTSGPWTELPGGKRVLNNLQPTEGYRPPDLTGNVPPGPDVPPPFVEGQREWAPPDPANRQKSPWYQPHWGGGQPMTAVPKPTVAENMGSGAPAGATGPVTQKGGAADVINALPPNLRSQVDSNDVAEIERLLRSGQSPQEIIQLLSSLE
jgi:hypothetical protein